jgi:hypothetical protein
LAIATGARAELEHLLHHRRHVGRRGDRHDLDAIAMHARHVERSRADRSRRAEDGDSLHVKWSTDYTDSTDARSTRPPGFARRRDQRSSGVRKTCGNPLRSKPGLSHAA